MVISNLQIPPPKIRPSWQENRGSQKIISRICTRFSVFSGFSQLQAFDLQLQAPTRPHQKKSCLKHYRRFYGSSRMRHNRRVSERMFNPPPSGRDAAIVAEPSRLCSATLQFTFIETTARPAWSRRLVPPKPGDGGSVAETDRTPSFASFAKPSATQPLPLSVNIGEYQ